MKTSNSWLAMLAVVAALAAAQTGNAQNADQFSFADDFLLSPNQSNSPTNIWQFFYGVNPANRNGSYQRMTFFAIGREFPTLTNVQHWTLGAALYPYIGKNTGPKTTTGINMGEGYVHPSNDGLGLAIGFCTPMGGTYNVSGYVRAADVNGGNGIRWYLDKGNGSDSLATGTILRGQSNSFTHSQIRLATGEFLYLVVTANGSYYGDSTGVSFCVTPDFALPRFRNCMRVSGLFTADIDGEPGRTVIVEVSTNLQDWLPLSTNVLGATPIPFSDPQSGMYPQRLYRLSYP